MLLSPLAAPFQPSSSMTGVIFNDGVPSLVSNEYDILHGIQDECLDENFPPSAQEAAELEAVEMFVDILATLSMLEEQEERARSSFCHITKRWEARREDGLVGKPRLAKNLVHMVDHAHAASFKPVTTTDLVAVDYSQRMTADDTLATRQRAREDARRQKCVEKKMGRMNQPRPLQQPRKQN